MARVAGPGSEQLVPGMVSVTFRSLSAGDVVELVAETALAGIEWGADVHVPPGDAAGARRVLSLTRRAGLRTTAYGSYYRAGEDDADGLAFDRVLRTAVELEAPTIRVWAGSRGSAEADRDYRERVVRDARRITESAARAGATVSFEFHEGTLADDAAAVLRLLDEVDRPNVRTFWQPPIGADASECALGLRRLLPRLSNVHAFHWSPRFERQPLSSGWDRWSRYLDVLAAGGSRHAVSLEFVRGDDPEQFLADAEWLVREVERPRSAQSSSGPLR